METRKIKINNSRLEIITWKDNYFPEEFKNKKILLSGRKTTDEVYYSYYSKIDDYSSDMKDLYYNKSVLVEGTRLHKSIELYDIEDIEIIVYFAYYMGLENKISKMEQLIMSTMDYNIINCYKNSFNYIELHKYIYNIMIEIASGKDTFKLKTISKVTPCESSTRFSLYTLIEELERTKSSVLLDPELIGKYNNVSVKTIDTRENVIYDNTKWCKVRKIIRNSKKANISISLDTSVIINVPENEYGVVPGPIKCKTVRTICIINDGKTNIPVIGVKVPNRLYHRLKSVPGLIISNGVFDDELILDLTVLPVVNRKNTSPCSSITLCNLEVKKMMSKYAMDYIKSQGYNNKEKKIDVKEQFLNKLGIIGGEFYYPLHKSKYSGNTIISEGLICDTGFPSNMTFASNMTAKEALNKKRYNNKYKKVVLEYLSDIDVSDPSKFSELYDFYKKQFDLYKDKLNMFKFRILMSRTGKLMHGECIKDLNKVITIGSEKFNFVFNYKNIKNYV